MASKYLDSFRKRAKEIANGCPLMDGREKGNADNYIDVVLTLEDAYRLKDSKGGFYYAVNVVEDKDVFFLSGGGLTNILDDAFEVANREGVTLKDVVNGLQFKFLGKVKTKSGNDFRPITVL